MKRKCVFCGEPLELEEKAQSEVLICQNQSCKNVGKPQLGGYQGAVQ